MCAIITVNLDCCYKLSSQQQKVKDYKEKCINIKLFIHINKMNLIEAVKFKN